MAIFQSRNDIYDAVVVGGGAAGLSAALVLGRSRRRVLVCDTGKPRNAIAAEGHSFFSRDGINPLELLQIGREQLRQYDSVAFRNAAVVDVKPQGTNFQITLDDGLHLSSRKLLLATGVVDELPEIEGFKEFWGKSVFHCPYCHGWEVRDQPIALYGRGQTAFELAVLLKGWTSDLVFCTDGASELSRDEIRLLAKNEILIREEKILRLEGQNGQLEQIVFANGESLQRNALFFRPKQRQHSELPHKLGCAFNEQGLVVSDEFGQTSVPDVYAAGDMSRLMQQIVVAASSGAMAAAAISRSLLQEDFK